MHYTYCLREIKCAKSQAQSRSIINGTLFSKFTGCSLEKNDPQSPVCSSSSSFSLNGSRLLGISSSRVPVFVRCADSYQELGQNFPWEKSNFPETWQVETFHTEHTFPQCLLASDLMARLTLGGLGFCMKLLLLRKLTFVTLCMEGTVVYLPLSPSFGRGH